MSLADSEIPAFSLVYFGGEKQGHGTTALVATVATVQLPIRECEIDDCGTTCTDVGTYEHTHRFTNKFTNK